MGFRGRQSIAYGVPNLGSYLLVRSVDGDPDLGDGVGLYANGNAGADIFLQVCDDDTFQNGLGSIYIGPEGATHLVSPECNIHLVSGDVLIAAQEDISLTPLGQLNIGKLPEGTLPVAGVAANLPAVPAGYLTTDAGTKMIPYYNSGD
jgi:hypothetical protein